MTDGPSVRDSASPQPRDSVRMRLRRSTPFLAGIVVALLGVLAYSAFAPSRPPITQRDVDNTVAKAIASVTPPPAFSQLAYRAVQPSLVLIQTKDKAVAGKPGADEGLGSGVVVTLRGDILT